ncbi:hypothetical protein [Burkholderia pseudomallei]|uniref:hypothetical protein n=1 Tax=Burkholderia pseudomallei TaxID=28450 RepID=UPI001177514A|nr:hypothetical protein [Burkholderia pseudomallei]MBD2915553.1 hypothetical protein [Burkholderia pseudomallei]MBD2920020.1 hypothetical protein [Burkholderia pseudomallei]MBD2927706.1 hypothetical protein [Burkholderia pseudomallei]MBD2930384.1 hypothetical protein [Burkholderia pseudomallei]MBD2967050.1 hypothetical protein [Burkholderia pseudomallei]
MNALNNTTLGGARVLSMSDYRRVSHSATSLSPSTKPSRAEVASSLTRCQSLLYIGITPDMRMSYGLAGVEYDEALNMREAAIYLLGQLQKIIEAGE